MTSVGSSTNTILKIYKSRINILNYMLEQNYNIDDYTGFSINEIDAMYCNSQLDMLITHKTEIATGNPETKEPKKVYIKYYLSSYETRKNTNTNVKNTRQISKATLSTIIEDLYEIENVLTKQDTLVIIIDEEPNETILNMVSYLYEKDGIFIVIHNIKRLQFNLLEHELVPRVRILNEKDTVELFGRLNLNSFEQLPEISRFDPVSLAIMLRPKQVVEFKRYSPTALYTDYYRVCV